MTPLSSWPSRLNASPRSRSPSIVVQTALTLRTRLILRPRRRSWTAGGRPSGSSGETLASPHESLLFRPLDEEWHANLNPPFEPRELGHAAACRVTPDAGLNFLIVQKAGHYAQSVTTFVDDMNLG